MTMKILVGTDTTASADIAVSAAAELAGEGKAELLVLYVRSDDRAAEVADPRKPADPQRYLARMTERFPQIRVRSWSEPGDPAERICEVAADERVDTIVLGNKGCLGTAMARPGERPQPGVAPRTLLGLHRGHAGGTLAVRFRTSVRDAPYHGGTPGRP
jgi:nucleotide-binding universal stress UspA family protein